MNISVKDVFVIAVVSLVSFPVLYISMLFFTGQAKVEFVAPNAKKESGSEYKTVNYSKKMDSIQIANTESFMAGVRERASLVKEKESLFRQQERINMLMTELDAAQNALIKEREKYENLVKDVESLDNKRIKQLSRVYESMRPAEAAAILETMDDDLFIKIMNSIGDDRQKAKIMAAISTAKASRVSTKMGKQTKK